MATKAVHLQRGFEIINADVTNHCNARCFFCFNDWAAFKPFNMTKETFRNLLTLLPLMNGTDFLVSCWFEPTINPDFFDMLDMLPAEYKDKVYFTTNLVTRISDRDMERMCTANVHHINVSLESWNEENYRSITNVRTTHFFDNLELMGRYRKKHGTDIHVITMLTRRNLNEFRELVRKTHDVLDPSVHEIRTPYFFIEDTGTKEALIRDMLTAEEIRQIRKEVDALGYTNLVWDTRFTQEVFADLEKNPQPHIDSGSEIYYRLRVNADGTARIGNQTTGKLFDINQQDGLIPRLREELTAMQLDDVNKRLVSAPALYFRNGQTDQPCNTDQVHIYDERFLYIRGWDLFIPEALEAGDVPVAVLACGKHRTTMKLRLEHRGDVEEALGLKGSAKSGYSVLFDLSSAASVAGNKAKPYTVSLGRMKDGNVQLLRQVYDSRETDPSGLFSFLRRH